MNDEQSHDNNAMRLVAGVFSVALVTMINAGQSPSIRYAAAGSQIIITDLGPLPGGTTSAGLAINSEPIIVGLATDDNLDLQRPFWDANTGDVVDGRRRIGHTNTYANC